MEQEKKIYAYGVNVTSLVEKMKINKPTTPEDKEEVIKKVVRFLDKHLKIYQLGIYLGSIILGLGIGFFFFIKNDNVIFNYIFVSLITLGLIMSILSRVFYSSNIKKASYILAKFIEEGNKELLYTTNSKNITKN